MNNDPALDHFYKLAAKEPGAMPGVDLPAPKKEEPEPEPEPLYPGNTPPRNSQETIDKEVEHWLHSLTYKEVIVGGEVKRMYTIGELCKALGNKPVTIRSWETKGWLPKATYRTPTPRGEQVPGKTARGKRLYSQEQVLFLVKAYDNYILSPQKANWSGFRTYIKRYYPKR